MIQIIYICVQAKVNTHEPHFGTSPNRIVVPPGALLTPVHATVPLDAATQARLIGLVATNRDRQAFALLFKHFAPRLKAFHLRVGMAEMAAEELAQETMILVWRKADRFDRSRAGAATWIFTITRNLRIDRARRGHAATRDELSEADTSPSAEAQYLAAERHQRMRGALASLSSDQRRVIELSFFSDTPHAAIATALNLPLGTVKSRIRLALAHIRDALGTEP